MAYNNTNSGALFKNEKRAGKEDTDPDYTGKLDVAGTEYWLSAWLKKGKNGTFMSLSVREKKAARHVPDPDPTNGRDADDIPF